MSKITTETEIDISDQLRPITKDLTLLFERVYTLQQGVTEILVNTPPVLVAPMPKKFVIYNSLNFSGGGFPAGRPPIDWMDDSLKVLDREFFPNGVDPGPLVKWDPHVIEPLCEQLHKDKRKIIAIDIEPTKIGSVPTDKLWIFEKSEYITTPGDLESQRLLTLERCVELVEMFSVHDFETTFYGGPVGHDSYWANVNKYRHSKMDRWPNWIDNTDYMYSLREATKYFSPSFYDEYDNFNDWKYFVFGVLKMPGYDPQSIPFLSPDKSGKYANGKNTSLPQEIAHLKEIGCPGCVLWSDGSESWSTAEPWLAAVKGLVGV